MSCRHRLRLFQVLVAVIGALDVLEETWQKYFMQLALEHMAKSTVGRPLIARRLIPQGLPKSL